MNKSKRRSNWYIYLITFVVAGVILYFVSNTLLNTFYESQKSHNQNTNNNSNQGISFTPDSTYDFTVLFMLNGQTSDIPEYYMTLTYLAEKNSIELIPYLSTTRMNGKTLKESYRTGGEEAVMSAINSEIGTSITKYVKFTKATMPEFFDSVGNTTISVPKNLKHENKTDHTLMIVNAGTQSFTGTQLYTYLTFPNYEEPDPQYVCKVHATSFNAFINQNFYKAPASVLEQYMQYVIKFCSTNITLDDFNAKKQALVYLFANFSEPSDYYIPYGEMSGIDLVLTEQGIKGAQNVIGIKK